MYTIKERELVWLDSFDFLSYHKKRDIILLFSDCESIVEMWSAKKLQLSTFLSKQEYEKVATAEVDRVDKVMQWLDEEGIKVVTILSDAYPTLLLETDAPPICLYCKGNTDLLNTMCCGVVGTRKPSDYGKVVTKQFVEELASSGLTIVSGMATGIDTIAHETTLAQEGSTIAVLAGGFHHVFPASNHQLFKKLCETNLVVTESLPNVVPASYLFPARNRIIAGLSKAVLITEAGVKSGSIHTKNYAKLYKREIFAVPGKVTSPESEGTNQIIKEIPNSICLSTQDIFARLGILGKKIDKKSSIQLDIIEQTILKYILADKKTYQEILEYTNMKPNELNNVLFNMQLKGLVEKLAGNAYIALIKL